MKGLSDHHDLFPKLPVDLATFEAAVNAYKAAIPVALDGSRTLVTRGAYRFDGAPGPAHVVTALQGNGWVFRSRHVIRLEVTQNDAPYLRLDNLPSTIGYGSVQLRLPTP